MYTTTDSTLKTKIGMRSECVMEIIKQKQIAIYYKSLSVGCMWSRFLWYHRYFINTSVSGASRRLSSSVSCHSISVFKIWLASWYEMQSHTRMCFQISSAFLVWNLSVWEIFLCWLISGSCLQSPTGAHAGIFEKGGWNFLNILLSLKYRLPYLL